MPWTIEKQRAAWSKWYKANRKRKLAWQTRRKRELREIIWIIKLSRPCRTCGEARPECLQFHHPDGEQKDFNIGSARASGRSLRRILAEIAKCVVLCANCHMKLHAGERRLRKLVVAEAI